MERKGDITSEVIDKIKAGELPELVEGELIFDWRDLKIYPKKL